MAAKTAVLAAYDRMTIEQAKAYRQASAKGTALEKYVTLNALSKIDLDLYRMKEAGTVVRGEIEPPRSSSWLRRRRSPRSTSTR
ncbi:hypothetical protein ACFVU0_18115 [Streptomyces sp. NPDC058122]|uniref:hypothetical protein n=1 Tax=Streptomyces sp. NPDC058122 TaxID=3346349 RepID=UPI0036E39CA2